MYIDGRMSLAEMASYIFAQCVGAMLGALGIYAIAGSGCGFGANGLPVGVENPALAGLVVETLLTFVFVLTVLGVTSKKEHGAVAGLAIGLALVAVHLVGIRYTGTGVNPARSLAPALLAGGDALANLWVFVIGPLAGGALAAICHRYLTGEKE
jgi:aquaporin Z